MSMCMINGCSKQRRSRGMCGAHYERWRKYGDPSYLTRTPNGEAKQYLESVVLNFDGNECLIWPYLRNNDGYAIIPMDGKNRSVNRIVCEAANGLPPTKRHQAAHSCGNGHIGCCARRHLSWKTPAENQADRVRHGTSNRGCRNGCSKLNEEKVRLIRALKGEKSQRAIADDFGIHHSLVGYIHRREIWSWVSDDARGSSL